MDCHPNCIRDEHHPSCSVFNDLLDSDLWVCGNSYTECRPGGLVRRIAPQDMLIREQRAEVQAIITAARP